MSNKKFGELIPGNSLWMLCISPTNDEPLDIINCIVDSINNDKTVVGVRYVDRADKSKMLRNYFRVNPDLYINDSLKEDKEHRMAALFETKEKAIEGYIYYCESKIQKYKENIKEIGDFI